MAGVKISKLKPYDEVFDEEFFNEFVNDMIVPVSLGNKTISVKIKELIHFINGQYEMQSERIDKQEELILQNTDLINQLTNAIIERIEELKIENDSEHQSILDKTDTDKNELSAKIDSNNSELIEKINTLKTENNAEHQSILDKTNTDKNELIEKIDSNNSELIEKINTFKTENNAEHQSILDKTNTDKNELIEKINTLDEKNQEEHNKIQDVVDENEKVTALGLIDLNQITQEILLRLHTLKESQEDIDKEQNEKINAMNDSVNLWEIYGNN